MPTYSTIDSIHDLLDLLRARGYDIGVAQYLMVERLLRTLEAKGELPAEIAKWERLIAPVVCSNPEEQSAFAGHFGAWAAGVNGSTGSAATDESEARRNVLSTPTPPVDLKSRWIAITLRTLAAAAFAVALYFIVDPLDPTPASPRITPPGPLVTTDDTLLVDTTKLVPVTIYRSQWRPPDTAALVERLPERSQWYWKNYEWVRYGAPALVVLLTAAWFLWRSRRRALLERRYSNAELKLQHYLGVARLPDLYFGPTYRSILHSLRRYRESEIVELNIERTIAGSIRSGGATTLVNTNRRTAPEYLVLIDRAAVGDQSAELSDQLVDGFAAQNVYVDRYYYRDDPRYCSRASGRGGTVSLKELASHHPNHHLLLFGDGAGLLDPLSGRPRGWVSQFDSWSRRALVTPEPAGDWTGREEALRDAGFRLVTRSPEGIASLAIEEVGGSTRESLPTAHSGYPESLHEGAERWVSNLAPPAEEVDMLRVELLHYLGSAGYTWLASCAIYPALHRDIVLHLGSRLVEKEELVPLFEKLTRLPWFRYGSMPDWLRTKLLSTLSPQKEGELRRLVLGMLESGATAEDGSSIPFVTLRSEELRGTGRGRDYVFLDFTTGSTPNRLALTLSSTLQRFLFERGDLRRGVRPWIPVAAAAIVATALLVSLPERPELPRVSPPLTSSVVASPSGSLPGRTVQLTVTSSLPDSLSLEGARLTIRDTTIQSGQSRFTIDSVWSQGRAILSAQFYVPLRQPARAYQIAIVRDTGVVGTFIFTVDTMTVGDSVITHYPTMTFADTTIRFVASSNDCERIDLTGCRLVTGLAGVVTIEMLPSKDRCRLEANVRFGAKAPVGENWIYVMRGRDTVASLSVVVVSRPVVPPRRADTPVRDSTRRTPDDVDRSEQRTPLDPTRLREAINRLTTLQSELDDLARQFREKGYRDGLTQIDAMKRRAGTESQRAIALMGRGTRDEPATQREYDSMATSIETLIDGTRARMKKLQGESVNQMRWADCDCDEGAREKSAGALQKGEISVDILRSILCCYYPDLEANSMAEAERMLKLLGASQIRNDELATEGVLRNGYVVAIWRYEGKQNECYRVRYGRRGSTEISRWPYFELCKQIR